MVTSNPEKKQKLTGKQVSTFIPEDIYNDWMLLCDKILKRSSYRVLRDMIIGAVEQYRGEINKIKEKDQIQS